MQAYPLTLYRTAWRWLTALAALLCIALPAHAVNQDDLLPPEKAFAAEVTRNGDKLELTLDVASGYYLYRDRISVSTAPADLAGKPALPQGQEKSDPYFGKQVIYHGKQLITIPLNANAPASFQLNVRLQGCAEAGVCYPPYTHKLQVGGAAANKVSAWTQGGDASGKASAGNSELAAQGWLATLGTFLLAGLGMAFTACMYPLLPIVSSLIAGQGATLTRRRGFLLSLIYVQGLALTYTAVGVVAGLTGSLLTVWLQQPAVVLTASALMVVFALSMFDLFSIQLPSSLQSKLADTSNQLSGGKALTVFLMGALSALLVGPCVAPPLALALGYIGSTGDAVLGGAALYAMALGLGLPLIVIGTFGGHVLPRAGNWMKAVKSAFGVVMLAVAIWLATPFLPATLVMLLWAGLLIGSAVFAGAFDSLQNGAKASARLGKALGLLLFLLGAAQLVGLLSGADNPRYPLKLIAASNAEGAAQPHADFQTVSSSAELDAKLAEAKAAGKPLLLDFYADWCVACKEMEAEVFPQAQVAAKMKQFVLLRADVTANSAEHQALLKRFGLFGPPGIILFDAQSAERNRVVGFTPAEAFAGELSKVAN
ncbi:protein-disulfide reductase DsbD [Chromobacterium sp. IIBBL 290-4]|uniref:protein-disulfide reductase DsbD n=1 Tax=Chromobacterium sp. IIBBL 290-4 TaxID=2953890 RepID=UPI0020B68787|nr:protein-disulfide reductase DsbD [Chromobacterium sp. IIBBL 290-4]UTH73939.1 protein-disulfide reductase DsbD [Chromobacterium sp. IIBBL 290-4]